MTPDGAADGHSTQHTFCVEGKSRQKGEKGESSGNRCSEEKDICRKYMRGKGKRSKGTEQMETRKERGWEEQWNQDERDVRGWGVGGWR